MKIGIIGCGRIFKAHIEAINKNSSKCKLVAITDINQEAIDNSGLKDQVETFNEALDMLVKMKGKMDMVVIATPNDTHYELAMKSLENGCDILVEKPVTFTKKAVLEINEVAKKNNRKAYAVLQVRYNPSVNFLKKIIDENVLGKIRSVSLVQRWQRPDEYFNKWFGNPKRSGGVLYEVGIHYLDIVQWLFGVPEILATQSFKLKPNNPHNEDTIYSIFRFKNGIAGSMEVGIAVEPHNLECSLTVIGENGFIKIGGKALNEITDMEFNANVDEKLKNKLKKEMEKIEETALLNYGIYNGSCPNHPTLYKNLLNNNNKGISIVEASNCIDFIEKIYDK